MTKVLIRSSNIHNKITFDVCDVHFSRFYSIQFLNIFSHDAAGGGLVKNRHYEQPLMKDLIDPSMSSWCHHSPYILKQGRVSWLEPGKADDENGVNKGTFIIKTYKRVAFDSKSRDLSITESTNPYANQFKTLKL